MGNAISFGLVGDVGVIAEDYRCLGPARYNAVATWGLLKGFKQAVVLDIVDARGVRYCMKGDFLTCFINQTQHFGKGLRAAPKARLDDGLMDLVCVKAGAATRGEMLAVLQQMPKGAHADNPNMEFIQCKEVTLDFGCPGVFNVDGEVARHDGRVRVSV